MKGIAHPSVLVCLNHHELVIIDLTNHLANGAASPFPSSEVFAIKKTVFLEPTTFEGYNFLKKYVNSKKGGKSEENIPEYSMTGKM